MLSPHRNNIILQIFYNHSAHFSTYRVIQEESAILWETIVCVILSKKVHMNMGPILNGYRDMVKEDTDHPASTNSNYVINNITTKVDTRADLVARINNACVRIKDRRHELRGATRSTLQRVHKCIENLL